MKIFDPKLTFPQFLILVGLFAILGLVFVIYFVNAQTEFSTPEIDGTEFSTPEIDGISGGSMLLMGGEGGTLNSTTSNGILNNIFFCFFHIFGLQFIYWINALFAIFIIFALYHFLARR